MPSSKASRQGAAPGMDIEQTLRALGVTWLRKVRTYGVAKMVKTLKEAMRTTERGLKVIIADGECQLARQRRVRAEDAEKLKRGVRVVKTRYGVDDEICTGDHSCIRLSGCPSLTLKPNPDPLRSDPVATVIESCVGCGLCGEVAHAAVLCPSFYRADIVRNPTLWDRLLHTIRGKVIGWLGGAAPDSSPSPHGGEGRGEGAPLSRLAGNPLTPTLSPPGRGNPPSPRTERDFHLFANVTPQYALPRTTSGGCHEERGDCGGGGPRGCALRIGLARRACGRNHDLGRPGSGVGACGSCACVRARHRAQGYRQPGG
jgi:hypothetical protein